eukprot:136986-Pyramimonas_sp.AAC.1
MASKTGKMHSKRAPNRPIEAPQTASDGVRRTRCPPRRPNMALRWPKTAQEASKRASRKARKDQKHLFSISV